MRARIVTRRLGQRDRDGNLQTVSIQAIEVA